MPFPGSAAPVVVSIAPGADLSADPATWPWVTITSDVRVADGITIDGGRRDEGSAVDTTNCTLTLNNRGGKYSPRNPNGPYYGQLRKNTPLRVKWSTTDRFVGYISELPPTWDLSGNEATVQVVATGILRRLSQGAPPLDSPLLRTLLSYHPVAYWPLEDPALATRGSTPLSGGFPMFTQGFEFATDEGLAGSMPAPTLGPGSAYRGKVRGRSQPADWTVQMLYRIGDVSGSNRIVSLATTGSTSTFGKSNVIQVSITPSPAPEVVWDIFDEDNILFFTDGGSDATVPFDGEGWAILRLRGHKSTSTLSVEWHRNGVSDSIAVTSGGGLGDWVGTVNQVYLSPRGSGAEPLSLAHVAVFDYDLNLAQRNAIDAAMLAYVGETAQTRMERVSDEAGVRLDTLGSDPDTTQAMGPQPRGTLLDVLRDCEAADGGTLHELDGGLGYLSRVAAYNQPVKIALDINSGDLGVAPQPTDDDQQVINDVTATRADGGSARYVMETGPLGADPATGIGQYAGSIEANIETDADLLNMASWAVHLGTVDEMRWPQLSLNFARRPSLLTSWLTLPLRGRITVAHPPSQIGGVTIDVLAEGWTETITPHGYTAEINAGPASPWKVGVLDDDALGKLDTDGTTLVAAVSSSATSLRALTIPDAPRWTVDPTECPFAITVAGETMTVAAITSAVKDTFTRTVSSGWGTATTVGGSWAASGGSASDFSVGSGLGKVSHGTRNVRRYTSIGSAFGDVEVLASILLGVTPTGGNILAALTARHVDASNQYQASLAFSTTSGTVNLQLFKQVAGSFTTIATTVLPGVFTAGTAMWVRFRVAGTSLSARTWTAGLREPAVWQATGTATDLATGGVGTHSVLLTANSNTLPVVISFDSFEVVNPQTMTVARSANGITKAQTAGAAIRLVQPLTLAR